MTKPNILILNCKTGEEIVREMNDLEYAQYLADQEALALEEQAKKTEVEAAKE
jgi:hypothetical protein